MSEVKGDDVASVVNQLKINNPKSAIIKVSTPDYDGGLETGYAKAVEAVIQSADFGMRNAELRNKTSHAASADPNVKSINVIAGSHLTPADFNELRDLVEDFGMRAIILPDLSALDGSRQGFSPLATGGTTMEELNAVADSCFTVSVGMSMEPAARLLRQRFGIEYCTFDGLTGLADSDRLMQTLAEVSGNSVPAKYERRRKVLVDAMRDAH